MTLPWHTTSSYSCRGAPVGHDPLLGPLTPHARSVSSAIEIGEIQSAQFRHPKRSAIEELKHGVIPELDRVATEGAADDVGGPGAPSAAAEVSPDEAAGQVEDDPAEDGSDGVPTLRWVLLLAPLPP